MQKIIILDTETTGTGEADRICQLSYLVCDEKGEILELHNDLCTPPLPIGFEVMAIHHITPEMIEGMPSCTETTAFKRLVELNNAEHLDDETREEITNVLNA
jgi:exodeoxyribonuclease X